MKQFAFLICYIGLSYSMTPKQMKQFINQNKIQVTKVGQAGLQNVSLSCWKALENKANALTYLDNTGRPGSGLSNGNTQWLGNYGACIKVKSAHYCYTSVEVKNKNVAIAWGLCLPKECTEIDVTYGLEGVVRELNILAEKLTKQNKTLIHLESLGEERYAACYKESKYTTGVIVTLTIIGIFILLCTVGTCWDLFESLLASNDTTSNLINNDSLKYIQTNNVFSERDALLRSSIQINTPANHGLLRKILLSFSLIKNTDQIMNTKVAPNSITCINGIRVISMFWVILGHTFLFSLTSGPIDNALDGLAILHNFSFMAVSNALFSVDSFFFLSGLLVGYLGWRRMEKNDGKLPIFGFYFHRFWRLTPVYMFVILIFDKLYGFLGKGPLWFKAQAPSPCDSYWWTNLLYINNFHPHDLGKECLGWSWYLANDMQFYVISPIILIVVYKWRWIGAALSIGSLTVISIIATLSIMAYYNLNALLLAEVANPNKFTNRFVDDVYVKPYCRITPYLVGLLVGYIFHRNVNIFNRERLLSWIFNAVGWFLAAALAITLLYGPYSVFKVDGQPFTKTENVLYGGFSRCLWGVALAWVVYACHNGFGGQVNRFLSASYWIPLSRLTYGAYLVHPVVLMTFYLSFQTPLHFTMIMLVFYFISTVALSYGSAFILAIFIELPLSNLEKLVFKM